VLSNVPRYTLTLICWYLHITRYNITVASSFLLRAPSKYIDDDEDVDDVDDDDDDGAAAALFLK
jgi:hypothetical protein